MQMSVIPKKEKVLDQVYYLLPIMGVLKLDLTVLNARLSIQLVHFGIVLLQKKMLSAVPQILI